MDVPVGQPPPPLLLPCSGLADILFFHSTISPPSQASPFWGASLIPQGPFEWLSLTTLSSPLCPPCVPLLMLL